MISSAFISSGMLNAELTPTYERRLICGGVFARPRMVVIRTTPFDPLQPQIPAADASYSTAIDSISFGLIVASGFTRVAVKMGLWELTFSCSLKFWETGTP